MNTSFGPRINRNRRGFHEGLMYIANLHLGTADWNITTVTGVMQEQEIGTVDNNWATYPPLHANTAYCTTSMVDCFNWPTLLRQEVRDILN